MDWPLDPNWKCETCGGNYALIWGLVHGECRCSLCHAEYTMRDWSKEGNPTVTTPISKLKEEYKAPAKLAWERFHIPEDELTDEQWQECGAPMEVA